MNDVLSPPHLSPKELGNRIRALQTRIDELQFGRLGRYVLFSHDPTGLGGQIARRVLAIRVGLISNRTVAFADEDFFPYENAFKPLAVPPQAAASPLEFDARLQDDSSSIVAFDFWSFWQNQPLKEQVYGYVPPELLGVDASALAFDGAIFSSFHLTQEYEDHIAPSIQKIKSLWPVIGVHFRRGDKYVETPYVTSEAYRAAIEETADRHNISNIFISSDSPSAIDELNLDGSRFNIFFDTKERRYNNANHKFLMKNQALAAQETRTAIRNIYMLGHCTKLVGQSNAHFATLAAGLVIVNNDASDFGVLIEPTFTPESWKAQLTYGIYRSARSIAKMLLPGFTLRHTKRGTGKTIK